MSSATGGRPRRGGASSTMRRTSCARRWPRWRRRSALRCARPIPPQQRQALAAIKAQLDETVRQTNQMLALARTDSAEVVARAGRPRCAGAGSDPPVVDARRAPAASTSASSRAGEPLRVLGAAGAAEGGAGEPAAQRDPLHAARRPGDGAACAADGQRGRIEVVDDGPGIPAARTGARRRALLSRQQCAPSPAPGSGWRSCGRSPSAWAASCALAAGRGERGLSATIEFAAGGPASGHRALGFPRSFCAISLKGGLKVPAR